MKPSLLYLLLLIFLSPGSLYSQKSKSVAVELIDKQLKTISKLNGGCDIGFSILSTEGSEITSFNERMNYVPASTLKIYTTAAAISLLGKNFKYSTILEYDGYIDKCGVLYGNLYIRGTGDPTLGSSRIEGNLGMEELINKFGDQIKEFGITKIYGNIIGDETYFDECLTPESWPYDDRANYYGAEPSGLSINENSYQLIFKPGKTIGSETEIITTDPPNIPGLSLKNKVTTFKPNSGDNAIIMENPADSVREIVGTIPAGVSTFTIRGSVPNPAGLAASLLYKDIVKKGIEVSGKAQSIYEDNKILNLNNRNSIYTHLSPPLEEIIKQINYRSHNLFAETLTVTIGKVFRGVGNHENGLKAVFEYWDSRGINIRKAEIFDGSGLSPTNKISAALMSSMLNNLQHDSYFENFLNTLPIAGETGTVKNFCRNTTAKGRIYAKSGSIEGVKSYAGYVISKNGKYLPFAVIVNNYKGNSTVLNLNLEKLMVLLTNIP